MKIMNLHLTAFCLNKLTSVGVPFELKSIIYLLLPSLEIQIFFSRSSRYKKELKQDFFFPPNIRF